MDDLGRRLEDGVRRRQLLKEPDLAAVVTRGRRVRLYRGAGLTAWAVILLVVSGLVLASVTRDGSGGIPVVAATEVADGSAPVVEDIPQKDQAEIFAFRAVAGAGLMDPLGDRTFLFSRSDYTRPKSDGWEVGFVLHDCSQQTAGDDEQGCTWTSGEDNNGMPFPDTFVDVALEDGTWLVRDVRGGTMSADEFAALEQHQLEQQPEPSHWEYPAVAIRREGEQPQVVALPLWVGPIPSEAPSSECVTTALGDDDEVIFESTFTEGAPGAGYLRAAAVRGQEFDDPDGRAVRAEVVCTQSGDASVSLTPEPSESEPYEPDPEREVIVIPEGPRYAIARGTLDNSWGQDSGKEWRYVVWGDHITHCWRLEIGHMPNKDEGVSCTTPGDGPYSQQHRTEPFSGHFYIPAGGEYQRAIAGGAVSPDVDQVEFSFGDVGGVVRVKALAAPPETTIQHGFFISFLPPERCGTIAAIDKNGDLLTRKPLMRGGCN